MASTKVRRDRHGLYVRTDGSVFRPVLTRYSYAKMQPRYAAAVERGDPDRASDPYRYDPDPSLFAEGDRVSARHISQTPFASVKSEDGREAYWVAHGIYYGRRADGTVGEIPSEECWHRG